MSSKTKNLGLFKYDTTTDGKQVFSIDKSMNANWDTIDSNTLAHRHVTNCILEIPQRIDYTLVDGTLTIKAGSVVIVPYGTTDLTSQYPNGVTFLNDDLKVYDTQFADGKFFVWAELVNDIGLYFEHSYTGANFLHLSLGNSQGNIFTMRMSNSYSGTTDTLTETDHHGFYNTNENMMYEYNATGKYTAIFTLPLFVIYGNGVQLYDRIDQVFNGMGYVGSTVWLDKGVKGLIPNGRNEDGTLSSIECIIPKLTLQTVETSAKRANSKMHYSIWIEDIGYYNNIGLDGVLHERIVAEDGYFYDNGKLMKGFELGVYSYDGSIVTNLKMKQPIRAVDYSDSSTVSGWGMPSSKYIDLTIGATNTRYTAPANGWVNFEMRMTSGLHQLSNVTKNYLGMVQYTTGTNTMTVSCIPVCKGDIFTIVYNNQGSNTANNRLRFMYAEGEI